MTNKNKRIILVTGASRGVGKGIAEGIAQPNDIIICAARSLKKGTTVSQFGFDVKSSLQETVEGIEKLLKLNMRNFEVNTLIGTILISNLER